MQWEPVPSTTAKPDRLVQIESIAGCFTSRWHQGYARGKLKHDPVFEDAVAWAERASLTSKGATVLDAGCGLGLLAHWLRANGITSPIQGIDPDRKKIAAASEAARRANLTAVSFAVGDARDAVGAVPAVSFYLMCFTIFRCQTENGSWRLPRPPHLLALSYTFEMAYTIMDGGM